MLSSFQGVGIEEFRGVQGVRRDGSTIYIYTQTKKIIHFNPYLGSHCMGLCKFVRYSSFF